MPAAVVMVASYAASSVVAAAIGGGILGAVVGGLAAYAVSSVLGSALGMTDKPQGQAAGQSAGQVAQAERGLLVNTASTIDPICVVYGTRRWGGSRVFTEVGGSNNEYLYLVIAHCEGPVSAINTVYLGGVATTDAKFSGLVDIEKHLGADDQVASAWLISELPGKWTSAHVGGGVAYTILRLKYDSNIFNGIPVVTADIDGRIVYDVRDSTYKFSSNPPLCIRDYMTNARFGRAVPTSDMDDDSFIATANTADITYTDPASATHAQHTCNGVVNTDTNSLENIRSMLTSCRGTLLYSARGYGLLIDKAETPTTFEFNEDNIVGSWTIGAGSKRTRFNRVRGNWFNPDRSWQPDIWPADSSTFRVTDNGLLLEATIELPYTTNPYEAQIKTERHMRQSRFGKTLAFRATIAGMGCEVGDVVPVTHSTPGYVSKPFRVQRIGLASSDEVDVEMTEYDDSVYSDTPLTTPRTTPVTNLPDPFVVATPGAPSISDDLFETTGSAGVKARATISWSAGDAFAGDYLPEYRVTGGVWIVLPPTPGLTVAVDDIAPGTYEFRYRARNSMGVVSAYSATTTKEIKGLTAVPIDPSGLYLIASDGGYEAEWTRSTDLDVKIGGKAVIRHSTKTSGAEWNDGVIVKECTGDQTAARVPLMVGTYMLKFADSSSPPNWSVNAAMFVPSEALLTGHTTVATSAQHPTFSGTKTGTVLVDGVLQLDGAALLDDVAVNFDDIGTLFDAIGGISSSGTYEFDAVMDMTTAASRKFDITLTARRYEIGDLFDAKTDLFDDLDGMFDGGEINDCDATVFVSMTNDDPAGSPTWGAWTPVFVGDFYGRAARFMVEMTSGNSTHNIAISELSSRARIQA